MKMDKEKQKKSYRIAATLFSLAGLVSALDDNISIGMMYICVGMMFLSLSASKKK